MNYLNREWAFNFIFYLCPLFPKQNILIITDRLSRSEIDFDLFDINVSFAFPKSCKGSPKLNQNIDYYFYDDERPHENIGLFDLVIIDLKKSFSRKILAYVSKYLKETSSVVHFDWSGSRSSIWFDFYLNFNIFKNRSLKISDLGIGTLNRLHLKWLFYVVPGLEKPVYLVRPGFRSDIHVTNINVLKQTLKRAGGFYLQGHQKIIVGQRNGKKVHDSPLEQIILTICKENNILPSTYKNVINRIIVSGTKILIMDVSIGGHGYFIRFPLGLSSVGRLEQQQSILKYLAENNINNIPQPLNLKKTFPFQYYIQEKIVGEKNIKKLFGKNNQGIVKLYSEAFENIAKIHEGFGEPVYFDQDLYNQCIKPMCGIIRENIFDNPQGLIEVGRIEKYMLEVLQGKKLKRSVCHGDYKIENCIYDRNSKLQGIIDWDMSEKDGLVLVDVAALFTSSIRAKFYPWDGLANFMLEFKTVPDEFLEAYYNYCEFLNVDKVEPIALILFYWLDRVSKLLHYRSFTDKIWINTNIFNVLKRMDYFISYSN